MLWYLGRLCQILNRLQQPPTVPAAHAMCTAFSVVTVSALLPWLRLT
jgi:hypothetical protein